jgi:hypothetical protein
VTIKSLLGSRSSPLLLGLLAEVEDDGVEGAVELAVAAAAETVVDRLAARGGQRCDAGESCEGRFGTDGKGASAIRPRTSMTRAESAVVLRVVLNQGSACRCRDALPR